MTPKKIIALGVAILCITFLLTQHRPECNRINPASSEILTMSKNLDAVSGDLDYKIIQETNTATTLYYGLSQTDWSGEVLVAETDNPTGRLISQQEYLAELHTPDAKFAQDNQSITYAADNGQYAMLNAACIQDGFYIEYHVYDYTGLGLDGAFINAAALLAAAGL